MSRKPSIGSKIFMTVVFLIPSKTVLRMIRIIFFPLFILKFFQGRCQQTSSIKDLLPEQVRFDPALYEKVDRKLFSRGRMDTAIPDDGDNFFSCGQNAMSLVVVTDKYAGLSTLEEGDFSLMDTNCNATTVNYYLI